MSSACAVGFVCIGIGALQLPPGCTTYIYHEADVLFNAWDSWQRASSGVIDALSPIARDALPHLLSRPHHNLTCVLLHLSHHTDHIDLRTALPYLKCLGVCAYQIYMNVPDTVSSLKVWSPAGVNIHGAGPEVLARNLTFLELRCDDYNAPGVSKLLEAMKSIGKQCRTVCMEQGMPEIAVYGERNVHTCPCGACDSCLSCKGILDPLLVPHTGLLVYACSH